MATRNDQIDALGDSAKGILKLLNIRQMSPVVRLGTTCRNTTSQIDGLVEDWIDRSMRDTKTKIFGAFWKHLKFWRCRRDADNVFGQNGRRCHVRTGPRAGVDFAVSIWRPCMGATAEVFLEQLTSLSGQNIVYEASPRNIWHGLSQGGYSFGKGC